jgi:hypothetical protein
MRNRNNKLSRTAYPHVQQVDKKTINQSSFRHMRSHLYPLRTLIEFEIINMI